MASAIAFAAHGLRGVHGGEAWGVGGGRRVGGGEEGLW